MQQCMQGRKLSLAAYEPTSRPGPALRHECTPGGFPQELVDLNRCWLPGHLHRPDFLRMHSTLHEPCSGGTAQNRSGFCALLESSRQGCRCPNHRSSDLLVVPHPSHCHESRVQAQAHGQRLCRGSTTGDLARLEPLVQAERRQHGPLSMILLGHGRTKYRHDAVARHVLDCPAISMRLGPNQLVQLAHTTV